MLDLFERKLRTQFRILPLRFSPIILIRRPSVQRRSKARVKSIKMATVINPDFKEKSASHFNLIIGSDVEKCFLKPAWLGFRSLFFSRNQFKRFTTIFSIILHGVGVSDIGRYELRSLESLLFFNIVFIIELFQSLGIFPVVHMVLMILRKEILIT